MADLYRSKRRKRRILSRTLAAAWGKRSYEKHFLSKLTDADAEQMETQHWVSEALNCGYLNSVDAERLNSSLEEIGRMLNSMMEKAGSFCATPTSILHEEAAEYFTTDR